MSDKSRVLCKYHMSGVCRFGADCAFSHDLTNMPNQVCKYYLAGCCAYGDRCRYDHKKAVQATAAATANRQPPPQQLLQHRQATAAASAQHSVGHDGGGGGARGYSATATAAAAHDGGPDQALRLPQSLFDESTGGGSGGSCGRDPMVAAAAVGRSGRRANGGVAWEEAAEEEDMAGSSGAAAGGALQDYDEGADEYGEYDDKGGAHGSDGSYYGEDYQYGTKGEGDAGGGKYDEYDGGGGDDDGGYVNGRGCGLVLVDDDMGLEQERVAAGAAVAAGGGGGSGWQRPAMALLDGAVDVSPTYRWAATEHPWKAAAAAGQGTSTTGGTAADPVDPADVELCPGYSLHGSCPKGEDCLLIHGLECEICNKFRIHPYNPHAADEHRATCRLRHERLEARLRSGRVECGICLEAVMDKPSAAERRFGLMLSCDHPFCLGCIRSWRSRTDDGTLATDTAVRTCPICRTPSHFVTPSLVWPSTPEEKAAIVEAYRLKLATIDCRHFDYGEGSCPFSTSCFYRHRYRDGRLEEPVLRRAGNADGEVRVVAPLRLSAFLDTPQAQRLLLGPRRR